MKVTELPSMTVLRIERIESGVCIRGHFDRLDGVGESGWFWPGPGRYVFAELEDIDTATGNVSSTAMEESEIDGIAEGDRLPWFDSYWQVPLVQAIIDEDHTWRAVTFQASPAVHFRLGKSKGWQPVGQELPEGAVVTHEQLGGWDHEHCSICQDHINGDKPSAYVSADGIWWLCPSCYERHGKNNDVSFQLGA